MNFDEQEFKNFKLVSENLTNKTYLYFWAFINKYVMFQAYNDEALHIYDVKKKKKAEFEYYPNQQQMIKTYLTDFDDELENQEMSFQIYDNKFFNSESLVFTEINNEEKIKRIFNTINSHIQGTSNTLFKTINELEWIFGLYYGFNSEINKNIILVCYFLQKYPNFRELQKLPNFSKSILNLTIDDYEFIITKKNEEDEIEIVNNEIPIESNKKFLINFEVIKNNKDSKTLEEIINETLKLGLNNFLNLSFKTMLNEYDCSKGDKYKLINFQKFDYKIFPKILEYDYRCKNVKYYVLDKDFINNK